MTVIGYEKLNPLLNATELRKAIENKVKELRDYTPKVGVFGVTGVGKSSLCNALFGKEAAAVSDVAACTRQPSEIFIGSDGVGIRLIDVPGVGETIERDKEYFELYKSLLPELDLVLWVIKADDRAYAVAEKAYKEILKPDMKRCPVLFVINQVDKLNPLRDWDEAHNVPGVEKQKNIDAKILEVSKAFDVSANYIEPVSVAEKYNLAQLVDKIIEVLPNEKKYSVLREAKEELRSSESQESAEKGVWETVKNYAGELWDSVKDVTVEVIAASATKVIKNIWGWLSFKVNI
ncbi:MAG: GTPase [Thiolinea sp.]